MPVTAPQLRMAELARLSGVSRELIHHYLREGLLPRPASRARYEERHLLLLKLIKRLREERFLPLPMIRDLVAFHAHDPESIELHLVTGAELAPGAVDPGELGLAESERLDLAELAARTRVPRATVERCRALGLIRGVGQDPRFTRHDGNIVLLAARAETLGIPLDALRTIRSYIDIGFELERAVFIPPLTNDLAATAREIALRRELAIGFVRSVLASLIDNQVQEFLLATSRSAAALPTTVYRPSEAFLRKHGVDAEIDELGRRLGRRPGDAELLARLVRLFFLSGRHREVVFAVEQRGPRALLRPALARTLGYALVLCGEAERGIAILEPTCKAHPTDPIALAYLAAARFHRLGGATRAEAALTGIQAVSGLVKRARQHARAASRVDLVEVWTLCGWIETTLPPACDTLGRGVEDLEQAYAAAAPDGSDLPVLERLRARITSAYLMCKVSGRPDAPESLGAERAAALRLEVMGLDPASELALGLFMESDEGGGSR